MAAAIVETEFQTAEDLLLCLRPEHPIWGGQRHFWAFRGLEDARFELLPKALRQAPPAQLGYTFAPRVGPQGTNRLQVQAEFERLHEFFWSIDAQGLAVPGDGHFVRTPEGWRQMKVSEATRGWPTDELLPVAALAQHYGVATRLLDWTEKPLVAAYFATRRSAEAPRAAATHIAIWALDFNWVIHRAWPGGSAKIAVFVVTAPRASNPNMHAQGGVFTAARVVAADLDSPVAVAAVNDLVAERHGDFANEPTVMHCLRLPIRQAPRLLRLIHHEGADASTLFPGYQGVADAIAERQFWDVSERVNVWLQEGFAR